MRDDGIIPNRNELCDQAYRKVQIAREYRTPRCPLEHAPNSRSPR
jgi:hypothetical protein